MREETRGIRRLRGRTNGGPTFLSLLSASAVPCTFFFLVPPPFFFYPRHRPKARLPTAAGAAHRAPAGHFHRSQPETTSPPPSRPSAAADRIDNPVFRSRRSQAGPRTRRAGARQETRRGVAPRLGRGAARSSFPSIFLSPRPDPSGPTAAIAPRRAGPGPEKVRMPLVF
ncbi:hypothetical protein GQ55_9G525000 [Panicum hallii var. hallii]|uniref:Uncharacterized protein n=1 Tax=Panicum hallii var. hallii TaxID=1504633 RepID=A0A2T7CEC1_9POAL|nr:hypothetical protein GQ55_9G525000 [Panicum hallii var. hallii]